MTRSQPQSSGACGFVCPPPFLAPTLDPDTQTLAQTTLFEAAPAHLSVRSGLELVIGEIVDDSGCLSIAFFLISRGSSFCLAHGGKGGSLRPPAFPSASSSSLTPDPRGDVISAHAHTHSCTHMWTQTHDFTHTACHYAEKCVVIISTHPTVAASHSLP